jgi:hypothetical protein
MAKRNDELQALIDEAGHDFEEAKAAAVHELTYTLTTITHTNDPHELMAAADIVYQASHHALIAANRRRTYLQLVTVRNRSRSEVGTDGE